MRNLFAFVLTLSTLCLGSCQRKDDGAADPAPARTPIDVKFYKPDASSGSSSDIRLQMTLVSDKMQFSTLGRFDANGRPQPAQAAFIFDAESNQQSVMLFDAQQQPAFIYGIDVVTGQRKPELIELVRISATRTLVRMYHYNWTSRLGTLLLETRADRTGTDYQFTKLFQNANVAFAGRAALGKADKTSQATESFPAPVLGLDLAEKQMATSNLLLAAGGTGMQARTAGDDTIADFMSWMGTTISDNQQLLNRIARPVGNVAVVAGTLALLGVSVPVTGTLAIAAGGLYWAAKATSIAQGFGRSLLRDHATDSAMPNTDASFDLNFEGTDAHVRIRGFSGYNFDIRDHVQTALGDLARTARAQVRNLADVLRDNVLPAADLDDLPDSNGVLQFGLSWNTATDIDLWVTDPSGAKIYYANRTSPAGGYLDRDDTDGYGPENVYYRTNIPDGNYLVQAHYYGPSGGPATQATINVSNGIGFTGSRTVSLAGRNDIGTAFTIRKTGAVLTLQ